MLLYNASSQSWLRGRLPRAPLDTLKPGSSDAHDLRSRAQSHPSVASITWNRNGSLATVLLGGCKVMIVDRGLNAHIVTATTSEVTPSHANSVIHRVGSASTSGSAAIRGETDPHHYPSGVAATVAPVSKDSAAFAPSASPASVVFAGKPWIDVAAHASDATLAQLTDFSFPVVPNRPRHVSVVPPVIRSDVSLPVKLDDYVIDASEAALWPVLTSKVVLAAANGGLMIVGIDGKATHGGDAFCVEAILLSLLESGKTIEALRVRASHLHIMVGGWPSALSTGCRCCVAGAVWRWHWRRADRLPHSVHNAHAGRSGADHAGCIL